MRRLIPLLVFFSPLTLAMMPLDQQVICEFNISHRIHLASSVAQDLSQILTENTFRIVNFADSETLLSLFRLKLTPLLPLVTARFENNGKEFELTLYNNLNGRLQVFTFYLDPVIAWPILTVGRQELEQDYRDLIGHENPFLKIDSIPNEVFVGTLITDHGNQRIYLAVQRDERGKVFMQIGVDLAEELAIPVTPIPQRLLRTPTGWVRRTHILTLTIDDEELRKRIPN